MMSNHTIEEKELTIVEMMAIRGGDGPEIDPDPQPIILPEEG